MNALTVSCSESVEGSAVSSQGVDDVHGGDGLSPGVLSVGDGVLDDALEESLEHLSGIVVDEGRDPLHASSSGQSPDGWLGDSLETGSGWLLGASVSLS